MHEPSRSPNSGRAVPAPAYYRKYLVLMISVRRPSGLYIIYFPFRWARSRSSEATGRSGWSCEEPRRRRPERTHSRDGDSTLFGQKEKWRAGSEIIDWSIPSESISTGESRWRNPRCGGLKPGSGSSAGRRPNPLLCCCATTTTPVRSTCRGQPSPPAASTEAFANPF